MSSISQEALSNWLDLSLNQNIPMTLLILANAFKMTETLTLKDSLRETLYHLPESVIDEIRLKVEHNREHKLQLLKEENKRIAEERKEAAKTAEAIRYQELKQWVTKDSDLASSSITFSASQLKEVADAVAEGMNREMEMALRVVCTYSI